MSLSAPKNNYTLPRLCLMVIILPLLGRSQISHDRLVNGDRILHEIVFTGQAELDKGISPAVRDMMRAFSASQHDKILLFSGNSVSQDFDPEDPVNAELLASSLHEIIKGTRNNKVYFIPGNAEWFDGKTYTVQSLRENEVFIQEIFGDNIFVPGKGCGEPRVKVISEKLAVVFIDTQWLIQGDDNDERKRSGCDVDNSAEFIVQLQDILKDHRRKHIIIAAHHPLQSKGFAGGHYKLMDHLFPFRSFSRAIMIPLPVLGSFITGIKKTIGFDQQTNNPDYRGYRAALESAIRNFSNITVIHSHENNIQVFQDDGKTFITAGGGHYADYVIGSSQSVFALGKAGYGVLRLYKASGLYLELFEEGNQKPVFSKKLSSPIASMPEDETRIDETRDFPSSMVVTGSKIYDRQRLGRFLFGENYRDVWSAEIKVPVLNLDSVAGGLTPIKQGGGFQTRSLRLENVIGEQFVLRSINKDVTAVVPPALRNTLAQSLIQDGISASHPYAAFIVPDLAEAAGVFHTNPQLVFLPGQKTLGFYNDKFKDQLYLFEERTGGRTESIKSFGYSRKLIGSPELIETIQDKYRHSVDQESFLRARLFDLWLGDWDRHQDQWRWARFKFDGHTIYKPVPRDRDQVFFKNDGPLNYLVSRPFFTPGLRKFGDKIDILEGLAFNARYVDRAFLNELTEKDFIEMAQDLQLRLTDDVIESALHKWPEQVYNLGGTEIANSLKVRRKDLVDYASAHHRFLSKIVSVTGTTEENHFLIDRIDKRRTVVKVWEVTKERETKGKIYDRVIDNTVTGEIRLFGLKGDDSFLVRGSGEGGPLVRIIGGGGGDLLIDSTARQGAKILAYDKNKGLDIQSLNKNVKSKKSDKRGVNRYNFNEWQMDASFQYPFVSFLSDEGITISYNVLWRKHGFRKSPFKSRHALSFGYATGTSGVIGSYHGYFTDVFEELDLTLNAELMMPTYVQQFYGLTNAYTAPENNRKREYHFVEGSRFSINPGIIVNIRDQSNLSFGPLMRYLNIEKDPGIERFIEDDIESGIEEDAFAPSYYTGFDLDFKTVHVNSPTDPTRGYRINLNSRYMIDVGDTRFSNLSLGGYMKTYIPLDNNEHVVWANNFGVSHIIGNFEFFDARYLANPGRMRGFRMNRFGGRSMVYNSTDLRLNLATVKNEAIPTNFGIHGSFDIGRVWADGENVDSWHYSYGGGVTSKLMNTFVLRISYFTGNEDYQISIGGNYSF